MRSVQSTLLLTKLSSIRSHRRSIILQKSFRLVACMILCAMHSQRGRAANSVGFIALSCLTTPNAICYQLTENAKVLTPVNNICGYAQKACIAFAMVTNNQNYEQATTLEETDSTAVVVPKEKKKSKKTVIKYDADDYDYPDWLNTTDPMNLASKETNLDSFQMTFCTFEHRKLIFGMTMQRFWYLTSSRFQLKFKSQQNSQMLSQTHRTRGSGFLGNYTFAGRTASCSNIKMAAVPEIFEANQGSKATRLNFYYIRYFLYMTGPDRSPVFSYRLLELPGLYRKNDYLRARRMCTGDNDCVAMRTNDYRNNCFLKNMCTSFLSWKTQVPPEEEFEKVRPNLSTLFVNLYNNQTTFFCVPYPFWLQLSILLMSVPIENGIWVAVTLSREPSIKEGEIAFWLGERDQISKCFQSFTIRLFISIQATFRGCSRWTIRKRLKSRQFCSAKMDRWPNFRYVRPTRSTFCFRWTRTAIGGSTQRSRCVNKRTSTTWFRIDTTSRWRRVAVQATWSRRTEAAKWIDRTSSAWWARFPSISAAFKSSFSKSTGQPYPTRCRSCWSWSF